MYRFAQVEAVLMTVYAVGADQRSAFRSRIKYFQKIGIARQKPGKGQKLEYEFSDICLWALTLELSEFGIEPTRIAVAMRSIWPQVSCHLVNGSDKEMLLVAYPYIMTFETIERQKDEGAIYSGLFGPYLDLTAWTIPKERLLEVLSDRAIVISLNRLRKRIFIAMED